MSNLVRSIRRRPSGNCSHRWGTLMTIVAMFGFAGLAFADSGTPVKHIGPGAKRATPIVVSDQDATNPFRDNAPPLASGAFVAPPANDTCAGAVPLTLNITTKGTTVGANNDYLTPATAGCYAGVGQVPTTAPGRDVVYSFTAPSAGKYSFRIIQQNPFDDIRTQNEVLYLTDCANAGTVNCIAGANRGQSAFFISSAGSSNNQSEEVHCYPMTSGQTVYVVFDDAAPGKCADNNHACFAESDCASGATCVPTLNAGGAMSLEPIVCNEEVEPNDTPAQATPFVCGSVGVSPAGASAHCYLGTRAGNICTRSGFLDQTLPNSNMRCSVSGAQCAVDVPSGVGNCPAGEGICQQHTDLDCDPRCDVGPNAGKSCTTQAFCNPVSDQGATCVGTCQIGSRCIVTATNADTGVACTPVCVGSSIPAVNGRYCSSLSGCPGGGTCTTTPTPGLPGSTCLTGETCSRIYNEGDVDFWTLGTQPAGNKVYAALDAKSANDYDWRMRITTPVDTLQFDDNDGVSRNGSNAPEIAGAVAAGTETFIEVSRTTPRASAPYELVAIVRPPIAAAQLEIESDPFGNDAYYGWPGDYLSANRITGGGYVRGNFYRGDDSDCFRLVARKGDLINAYGEGNPYRITAAGVRHPAPVIYDAEPAGIANFVFGADALKNTLTPAAPGNGLFALSPAVTSTFI